MWKKEEEIIRVEREKESEFRPSSPRPRRFPRSPPSLCYRTVHRRPGRRGLPHAVHDFLVARLLLEADREVHDGDVHRRDPEGHARELALELREHGPHGLGGSRRGGDDVGRGLFLSYFSDWLGEERKRKNLRFFFVGGGKSFGFFRVSLFFLFFFFSFSSFLPFALLSSKKKKGKSNAPRAPRASPWPRVRRRSSASPWLRGPWS